MSSPDTPMSALPEDDGLLKRLRLIEAWRKPGGPTPKKKCPRVYDAVREAATRIETLSREIERLQEFVNSTAFRTSLIGRTWLRAEAAEAEVKRLTTERDGAGEDK